MELQNGYEGDFPYCWGNFIAEELVRRGWKALVRGGYCGHSETYLNDNEVIWWAHGGKIYGESAARFGFMGKFLSDVPEVGLKQWKARNDYRLQWDDLVAIPEDPQYFGQFYFYYYGFWRPAFCQVWINDDTWYDVDIIDTWNMTIEPAGRHRGRFEIKLPRRQYMGISLRKSDGRLS